MITHTHTHKHGSQKTECLRRLIDSESIKIKFHGFSGSPCIKTMSRRDELTDDSESYDDVMMTCYCAAHVAQWRQTPRTAADTAVDDSGGTRTETETEFKLPAPATK